MPSTLYIVLLYILIVNVVAQCFFFLARPTGRIKIVKLSSTLAALHRQIVYIIIIIIVLSGAAPEFL